MLIFCITFNALTLIITLSNMDFGRIQIKSNLNALVELTQNVLWLTALLKANGLLSESDRKLLLVKKDRATRNRRLYEILMKQPLDTKLLAKSLEKSKNENLLQYFSVHDCDVKTTSEPDKKLQLSSEFITKLERLLLTPRVNHCLEDENQNLHSVPFNLAPKIFPGSIRLPINPESDLSKSIATSHTKQPTDKPHSKSRIKPKPPQYTQEQLEAAKKLEGELPDIIFSIIGLPGKLFKFTNLPITASCLTTIKLKYVSINASTFAQHLIPCVNLEFLELENVTVQGHFKLNSNLILPKLTEYFYSEIKSSGSLDESLNQLKYVNYNWQRFLFFKKHTAQNWELDKVWHVGINIKIQIAGNILLCIDHDRNRLTFHSPQGQEIINGIRSLDSLSLHGATLLNYNSACFKKLAELNLRSVACPELNKLLLNCPSLFSLTVNECPQINLDIKFIPKDIKILSLNIGRLIYSPRVILELDSLCLYNTDLEQSIFTKFIEIFTFERIGLGGSLNGSCLGEPVSILLKSLLCIRHIDSIFLWEIPSLKIDDTSVGRDCDLEEPGWVYESLNGDFKGRSVTDIERRMLVHGFLGLDAF